ncbi:hypothetical protein [Dendrosporobacter sp. 1207_IL3150]|uniref:hypothetical protein n=1 Tax=Dendrosporobacter sp. 1207_IL3150 TaxID=3084054 RepID=UPI002FDB273B
MFTTVDRYAVTKIVQGVLLLIFIIVLGVNVAENQLNKLTHRHDYPKAFSVRRDNSGQYTAYLFGNGIDVKAVYSVANIDLNKEIFKYSKYGFNFDIPTNYKYESEKILDTLYIWYKQFITEAINTKQKMQHYLREFSRDISNYIKQIR